MDKELSKGNQRPGRSPASKTSETTKNQVKLKEAIARLFVDLEQVHTQMKLDQEEIERSRARTRAMLAKLNAA